MILDLYITRWYSSRTMILKTRAFSRCFKKTAINDKLLVDAVGEMMQGLIDADLGGGFYKKRVALPGRGKSGSVRTLLASNRQDRWIFMFGFEKNDRANISNKELEALKMLAADLLGLTDDQIGQALDDGAWGIAPFQFAAPYRRPEATERWYS